MAKSRRYKRVEKNIVASILSFFGKCLAAFGRFFVRIFTVGDRKLTIMLVPHSQSKVLSFQTNVFSLILGFVLIIGIISSFFFYNIKVADSGQEIARLMEENRQTIASLDELRSENDSLLEVAKRFQTTLNESLSLMGVAQVAQTEGTTQNSDLSSLFDVQELSKGSVRESADIRQLTAYLESSMQPVEQMGELYKSRSAIFADIPSIWPLKGGSGVGHISMMFGQNVHPITGKWYIHKGMDFSTWRTGDPVVATANGRVVTVMYDQSFGNMVVIQHKYGYYTRYAHLKSFTVTKGQVVSQGDVIGYVGNTGISTGAHLHYEVHIGSEVVDPAKYINVKLTE